MSMTFGFDFTAIIVKTDNLSKNLLLITNLVMCDAFLDGCKIMQMHAILNLDLGYKRLELFNIYEKI